MNGELIERLCMGTLRAYRSRAAFPRTPVTCDKWTDEALRKRTGARWCGTDSGDGHRCRFYVHTRDSSRCACFCGQKWRG